MDYFKKNGKWYKVSEFLGTDFIEEVKDKDMIEVLELAEKYEDDNIPIDEE